MSDILGLTIKIQLKSTKRIFLISDLIACCKQDCGFCNSRQFTLREDNHFLLPNIMIDLYNVKFICALESPFCDLF